MLREAWKVEVVTKAEKRHFIEVFEGTRSLHESTRDNHSVLVEQRQVKVFDHNVNPNVQFFFRDEFLFSFISSNVNAQMQLVVGDSKKVKQFCDESAQSTNCR